MSQLVDIVISQCLRMSSSNKTADTIINNSEEQRRLLNESPFSTMLFLNTAERARAFADAWNAAGLQAAEVHGLLTRSVRDKEMRHFREEDVKFLICTDACARGFDLPHVRRVVQVDFALNVVQHLHRVGRASRAGVRGKAVNIFAPSSKDLVNSIVHEQKVPDVVVDEELSGQTTNKNSTSIEQSFSRRRGFRQKLKKAYLQSHPCPSELL
jgi:superfamily II DNA/RNA helicase